MECWGMKLAQQASHSINPTLLYSISHGVSTYSGFCKTLQFMFLRTAQFAQERRTRTGSRQESDSVDKCDGGANQPRATVPV
jgi:hypothetical protein